MSSNQTVLEALAKEGVVTTEEALLRAVKDQQSISAPGFSAPGMPPLEDLVVMARPPLADGGLNGALQVRLGTPRETTWSTRPETETEHPVPSSDGEGGEPAHGITGTWRAICALAGRGMCWLGIHPAPWVYLHQSDCNQLRDCERCGATKLRVKHQPKWQYVGPKTCCQTKVCQRCDSRVDSRTHHEAWSESWSVGSDERAHKCKRCGVIESWSTGCGD